MRVAAVWVTLLLASTVASLRPSAVTIQARPLLEELIQDLQAKYDAVRDFTATFEHEYHGGLIRTTVVEHGTVVIKKPGKMHWRYTSAEDNMYVSDGTTFYAYFPFDRQVIVTPVPSGNLASTPALFLAGRGNILEDFVASYDEDPAAPGTWAIRLVPIRPDTEYDWLTVFVEQTTLSLVGLSTVDAQGGQSTYRFSDLAENQNPPDSLFVFDIPDGVDVIADEPLLR